MKSLVNVLVVGLAMGLAVGVAVGKQSSPPKPKHLADPALQKDANPVTKAEARKVLLTMQEKLWSGLHMGDTPAKVDIQASNQPVTRTEVVREFERTFSLAEPSFKFTPAKVKFDSSQFTLSDAESKTRLKKLVAWGAVARLGPLACGSKPTLGIHDFGDAVGFFISRVSSLTHYPSSRWTPYLNGGRG